MSSISEKNSSYLTAEEREQYLSELTENQQAILQKYKRYKINSALFTQLNQKGAFGKLYGKMSILYMMFTILKNLHLFVHAVST